MVLNIHFVMFESFTSVFFFQILLYMEYNFFDYDTDHPDLSVYDIHQCYSPRQSEELVIVFPGESNIHCETFEI